MPTSQVTGNRFAYKSFQPYGMCFLDHKHRDFVCMNPKTLRKKAGDRFVSSN